MLNYLSQVRLFPKVVDVLVPQVAEMEALNGSTDMYGIKDTSLLFSIGCLGWTNIRILREKLEERVV